MPIFPSIDESRLVSIPGLIFYWSMGPHNSKFDYPDVSGERPRITASNSRSKFKTGQKVYLDEPESRSLSGPFLIASVREAGKYTLCFENGDPFRKGTEFKEDQLSEADKED